jgi:hypothetical protein
MKRMTLVRITTEINRKYKKAWIRRLFQRYCSWNWKWKYKQQQDSLPDVKSKVKIIWKYRSPTKWIMGLSLLSLYIGIVLIGGSLCDWNQDQDQETVPIFWFLCGVFWVGISRGVYISNEFDYIQQDGHIESVTQLTSQFHLTETLTGVISTVFFFTAKYKLGIWNSHMSISLAWLITGCFSIIESLVVYLFIQIPLVKDTRYIVQCIGNHEDTDTDTDKDTDTDTTNDTTTTTGFTKASLYSFLCDPVCRIFLGVFVSSAAIQAFLRFWGPSITIYEVKTYSIAVHRSESYRLLYSGVLNLLGNLFSLGYFRYSTTSSHSAVWNVLVKKNEWFVVLTGISLIGLFLCVGINMSDDQYSGFDLLRSSVISVFYFAFYFCIIQSQIYITTMSYSVMKQSRAMNNKVNVDGNTDPDAEIENNNNSYLYLVSSNLFGSLPCFIVTGLIEYSYSTIFHLQDPFRISIILLPLYLIMYFFSWKLSRHSNLANSNSNRSLVD